MRKFVLEGKTENGWQLIFESSAIGQKFIHRMDEQEVSALRLCVSESKREPAILDFSAFSYFQD